MGLFVVTLCIVFIHAFLCWRQKTRRHRAIFVHTFDLYGLPLEMYCWNRMTSLSSRQVHLSLKYSLNTTSRTTVGRTMGERPNTSRLTSSPLA